MPRIRTVKPEFLKHWDLYRIEQITNLPIRLSFLGLWLCSDKEGRFKWQPQQLKLDVLPYNEVDFEEVLHLLCEFDFLKKYEHLSKYYGFIPTLKDHQRITGSEANSESKLPIPTTFLETPKKYEGNTLETLWCLHITSIKKNALTIKESNDYEDGSTLEALWNNEGNTLASRKGTDIYRKGTDEVGTVLPEMTKTDFDEFHKKILTDYLFTEPLCIAKGIKGNDELDKWLFQYDAHIVTEGKINKNYIEYRKHFKNWINRKDSFLPSEITHNGQPKIKL